MPITNQSKPGCGDIVVLGGYGAVGRTVTAILGPAFPGRVVVAGRDGDRARRLAAETKGAVRPLVLDLADPGRASALVAGADLVVACTDSGDDVTVPAAALRSGTSWVDISASSARLAALMGLDPVARASGSAAVLSVGLCPGLTNLLSLQCKDSLDGDLARLDIAVMLGLGERHGPEAIRWTLERLAVPFTAPGVGRVAPFSDAVRAVFPGVPRVRSCYRFDFADQHTLADTLDVSSVATRLCFDSAAFTSALVLARRTGCTRLLKSLRIRKVTGAAMGRIHPGSDRFAVTVRGTSTAGDTAEASASGRGEAHATAVVATAVAASLLSEPPTPPGCQHIDQLPEALTLLPIIEQSGIAVHSTRTDTTTRRSQRR
jgi:saccharopine dehydrogenase-like NADP-dependent oxidoreductase